jgi:transposase
MARTPSKTPRRGARPLAVPGALPVARELLTAGVDLDADVEAERQGRFEALKATLLAELAAGRGEAAIDRMLEATLRLERENERLAWRVLRANRYRFGHQTEKLSREELRQLALALGGEPEAAEVDAPQTPAPQEPEQVEANEAGAEAPEPEAAPGAPANKKRTRVRKMTAGASVERIVTDVAVPEGERACVHCKKEMPVFDHVERERIAFVPAKIVVYVERREKRSCSCGKDAATALRASAPAVERKVDASFLAKLVADKAALSLPLDRQRRELGRLGLDVPQATLASYWAYVTDLLEPVAVAAHAEVLAAPIVGADDTVLKTLTKGAKGNVTRAHLWCFVATDGAPGGPERVAYGYAPSWGAADVADWFGAIEGAVQCDGYAGYATTPEASEDEDEGEGGPLVPPERRLGCGMHVRSKFHDAFLAKDARAGVALKLFAGLYRVEAECKERGLDAAARGEERRRRSRPLLDELDRLVDDWHPKLLPKSPLRRATTYAQNQRAFFRRCFEDGRFEIDNGRVERRIRLFAVGRRNFLFTGSARGGERLAAAYTLVDNCLLLGVDPFGYLLDVITKLEGGWPLRQLSELVPWRWAAEQAAQKRAQ